MGLTTLRAASVVLVIALTAVRTALGAPVIADSADAGAARGSKGEDLKLEGAPAVVLLQSGEVWPMDPPRRTESVMHVRRRVRILNEAGAVKQGQVWIPTSPALRLTWFEGSTTTPDGEVLALPPDAVFSGRPDEPGGFVTAVFPRVGIGAVLEYRYEIRYASRLDIDPWFFQQDIPVLESELRYHVPPSISAGVWRRISPELDLAHEARVEKGERTLTFRMRNLPAVAAEPFGPPFADRASQVVVYPKHFMDGSERRSLLDRWETVGAWYGRVYDELAPLPRDLRRDLVHHLLAGVTGGEPMRRARALYDFVRDEIATSKRRGVWLQSDSSLERVLVTKRGSATEKTLLLESLLRETGLAPRRVWAGDRNVREVDPALPNPMQVEKLLLSLESEATTLFLDPSDRRLPFGCLLPENEGVWAVPVDPSRALPLRLPVTTADHNGRDARIELAFDAEGRLSGRGAVVFSGHHALYGRSLGDTVGQRHRAWVEWLAGAFGDLRIEGLHVEESSLEQRLVLRWEMAQPPDLPPNGRADLIVNRPALAAIGPPQVDAGRTVPVVLPFAGRDELEVRVTWERELRPDRLPSEVDLRNAVGSLRSRLTLEPSERRLIYRRTFALDERDIGPEALGQLRALLAAKQSSDVETLGLVRSDHQCSRRFE